jgi:hypothetical protein
MYPQGLPGPSFGKTVPVIVDVNVEDVIGMSNLYIEWFITFIER